MIERTPVFSPTSDILATAEEVSARCLCVCYDCEWSHLVETRCCSSTIGESEVFPRIPGIVSLTFYCSTCKSRVPKCEGAYGARTCKSCILKKRRRYAERKRLLSGVNSQAVSVTPKRCSSCKCLRERENFEANQKTCRRCLRQRRVKRVSSKMRFSRRVERDYRENTIARKTHTSIRHHLDIYLQCDQPVC